MEINKTNYLNILKENSLYSLEDEKIKFYYENKDSKNLKRVYDYFKIDNLIEDDDLKTGIKLTVYVHGLLIGGVLYEENDIQYNSIEIVQQTQKKVLYQIAKCMR